MPDRASHSDEHRGLRERASDSLDPVGEALRGLLLAAGVGRRPEPPAGDIPARLAAVERDVQEVRTRITALFFAVLTAGIGQLAGRLVLG